jgi:DnaJ-domain-containing protein 1
MDPFDLLGLPATFSLTPEQIGRAYLARAASVHPDLSDGSDHDSDDDDRSLNAELLNQARGILLDTELRAAALLTRLGGPGPQERAMPPGFLSEMMELRESAEAELVQEGQAARLRWRAWAAERRAAHIARATSLFAKAASATSQDSASVLREIRIELNAWRYIERMIEQLTPGYNAGNER